MRHRKQGRALSRNASHRRAMLANLATSVLEQERVQTTTAKAKEVRRLVERLITFGKRNDLHARRQALRVIQNNSVVAKLFSILADRYADRAGGYTRIIHIGHRQGDAAEMSILELVDREGTVDVQAAEPKKATTKTRPRKKAEPTPEVEAEEVVTPEVEAEAEVEAEETKTKKPEKDDASNESEGEDKKA